MGTCAPRWLVENMRAQIGAGTTDSAFGVADAVRIVVAFGTAASGNSSAGRSPNRGQRPSGRSYRGSGWRRLSATG